MKTRSSHSSPPPATQRGVSLVIVLLFLLAITGLTVWAARQSMLGEGMSRNKQDLEVARQAAESALRDAERDLKNAKPGVLLSNASCSRGSAIIPAQFKTDCTGGLCTLPKDTDYAASQWSTATAGSTALYEPWWPKGKGGLWNDSFTAKPGRTTISNTNCGTFTGGVPLGTFTGAPAIKGVAVQPEYIIEYFKRGVASRQEMAVYRITARGFGYVQRTQVVLQATFLPE